MFLLKLLSPQKTFTPKKTDVLWKTNARKKNALQTLTPFIVIHLQVMFRRGRWLFKWLKRSQPETGGCTGTKNYLHVFIFGQGKTGVRSLYIARGQLEYLWIKNIQYTKRGSTKIYITVRYGGTTFLLHCSGLVTRRTRSILINANIIIWSDYLDHPSWWRVAQIAVSAIIFIVKTYFSD